MDVSLFSLFDRDPRTDRDRDVLSDRLELCVRAEALGLDRVWIAEHHFADFGAVPNPAVLLSAVAQRTRTIRLASAVAVLPLRSPLLVAEDYAMVDRLSGGRLDLGVGSGSLAAEFAGFGIDHSEKRPRFEESLAVLEPLWDGDAVATAGEYVRLGGVATNVRPAQAGIPIYVATMSPEGARAVGATGRRLLTLSSPDGASLDSVLERLRAYGDGRREAGHDTPGSAAVSMLTHVASSDQQARQVRDRFGRFAESHAMAEPGRGSALFDAMFDRRTALFGGADRVAAIVDELRGAGATEIILWVDFGGLPAARAARVLEVAAEAIRAGSDDTGWPSPKREQVPVVRPTSTRASHGRRPPGRARPSTRPAARTPA